MKFEANYTLPEEIARVSKEPHLIINYIIAFRTEKSPN